MAAKEFCCFALFFLIPNCRDGAIPETRDGDVGSVYVLITEELDSHMEEMRFPRNAPSYERAEGRETFLLLRRSTRQHCPSIDSPGKPTLSAHEVSAHLERVSQEVSG